uniref:Uncharacterized protein n=1 Tax=Anguilla anguilla TaxID=7936 RepID=A0A0E9PEC2_ANGAN
MNTDHVYSLSTQTFYGKFMCCHLCQLSM